MKEDTNEDLLEIQLKPDLSRRMLKSSRKGKKQGNIEKKLPIWVQPKCHSPSLHTEKNCHSRTFVCPKQTPGMSQLTEENLLNIG